MRSSGADIVAGLPQVHKPFPLVGEFYNLTSSGDRRVVFVVAEAVDDQCEQVLRRFSSHADDLAVIAMCSNGDIDEALALRAGADAYVPIELDVGQLRARLRSAVSQIRRMRRPEHSKPPIRLDAHMHQVRVFGQTVQLSQNQFRLLEELQRRRGSVVSHSELEMLLWGETSQYARRSLTQLVYLLRSRLGEAAHLVANIPRVGYIVK